MKFTKLIVLLVTVALLTVLVVIACSEKDNPMKDASGTYAGQYSMMVGDNVKDQSPFSLILKADGTGIHSHGDAEFQVTWKLNGEQFTMEENFLGLSVDYTGTLKDGTLDIFNGDPENSWTYEYIYVKQ